ncbi:MAG: DUF5119 domain-containing protein [Bacteroidales bacterium]|nr:DUF5119 domain-containing protein [Bacteroidales bacterium]
MTKHELIYHIPIIAATAILLSACSLDDDFGSDRISDGVVNVGINWGEQTAEHPESMSVLFYPTGGGPYWRFELSDKTETVRLPYGLYHVLSYNSDTSDIVFLNSDSYDNAIATSREARLTDGLSEDWKSSQPPRDEESAGQPVMTSPDAIWGSNTHTFKRKNFSQNLTLYVKRLVARYTVNINNVGNSNSAYIAGYTISGLSAGIHLSSMSLIPTEVTIPGSLRKKEGNSFSGRNNTFGRIKGRGHCILSVYFMLRDGTKKVFRQDVTETIENAPDPFEVEINVSGIQLPDVSTSHPDSGLDVGIDDWDTVDIELST